MAKETQPLTESTNRPTNGNNNHLRKRTPHNQTKATNGKRQLSSMTIEEQFNAAVNVIQNLPKNGSFQPSDQLKLKFYAYYKQALDGPNQTPKPSFYEIVNRYKWDAWAKVF